MPLNKEFRIYNLLDLWIYMSFIMHILPSLLFSSGLVSHICNLFTKTATLCLDVDNKNNNETAAALLFSLLDILHGMLTYTSSIVRLALQVKDAVPLS